jgi:hypothetical protein
LIEPAGFDLFIADLFNLYNALTLELPTNRRRVIRSGRRALAVLNNYRPNGDGEEILIEIAIEQFEELVSKAGGHPR